MNTTQKTILKGNYFFTKVAGEWAIAGPDGSEHQIVEVTKKSGETKIFKICQEIGTTSYGAKAYKLGNEIKDSQEDNSQEEEAPAPAPAKSENASWTKFENRWLIRSAGKSGDRVEVVTKSGKSQRKTLGQEIVVGIFEDANSRGECTECGEWGPSGQSCNICYEGAYY